MGPLTGSNRPANLSRVVEYYCQDNGQKGLTQNELNACTPSEGMLQIRLLVLCPPPLLLKAQLNHGYVPPFLWGSVARKEQEFSHQMLENKANHV